MITLTTDEQALVRFKTDSRITEADFPTAILTELAEEAENTLKLRLTTTFANLPVASQAIYRSAVINLTVALAVGSVRPQVQQRAGPVTAQWERREDREKTFLDLYNKNLADLVAQGFGPAISGTVSASLFEVI